MTTPDRPENLHPTVEAFKADILTRLREVSINEKGMPYTLVSAVYDAVDGKDPALTSKKLADTLIDELSLKPQDINRSGANLLLDDFDTWEEYYREMATYILFDHLLNTTTGQDKALIESRFDKEADELFGGRR